MAKSKSTSRATAGARRKGGASPSGEDIRTLTRDAAVAALTRLAELANSEDERIALAASQELLNRAFGKSPAAASDDPGQAVRPLVIRIVRFGTPEADEASEGPVRQTVRGE